MVKENLEQVEKNIDIACKRANRSRKEVTLIAVSKTKPVSMIYEAMRENIIEFGENKVQEICDKIEEIKEPLNWHMIGHLQRNKVKYIVDKVCMIHSVDSYRLAEQINIEAEKKHLICPILIEVNVAEEDSKFGVSIDKVLPLICEISKFEHIAIKGLMTVAPYVEDPEENRFIFKKMKKLYIDIKSKNIDNVSMDELSMGMTGDYQVAIEEGATLIRVGTGIFGDRNYNS
ncbi:MAG: YggS family pyridoxal phosphate-dependent enzyme [Velocimicrobium sp.]